MGKVTLPRGKQHPQLYWEHHLELLYMVAGLGRQLNSLLARGKFRKAAWTTALFAAAVLMVTSSCCIRVQERQPAAETVVQPGAHHCLLQVDRQSKQLLECAPLRPKLLCGLALLHSQAVRLDLVSDMGCLPNDTGDVDVARRSQLLRRGQLSLHL